MIQSGHMDSIGWIWIALAIFFAGYLTSKSIEKYKPPQPNKFDDTEDAQEGGDSNDKFSPSEREEKFGGKYPHLVGNIENSWLEVFGGMYVEKGLPHLRAAENMYLVADNNTKQDVEVDFILCDLWDLTNELLEHLEKYHESTEYEYEIAVVNYWQQVSTEAESFDGENNQEVIRRKFQNPPYTDLQEIVLWFPKKKNHPKSEIKFNLTYVNKKPGPLPRKTKFPDFIKKKLKKWDATHATK